MGKRYGAAFLLALAFGAAMHGLYHWLPMPLAGLVCPVNESVWEHLKLLFFPVLLAGIGLGAASHDPQRTWSAVLAAALGMPLLFVGLHYVLCAGFALPPKWVDAALHVVCTAFGFFLAYRLERTGAAQRWVGILVMLAGVAGACFVLFSLAAPSLPIFCA